jgi:hypothetical protein
LLCTTRSHARGISFHAASEAYSVCTSEGREKIDEAIYWKSVIGLDQPPFRPRVRDISFRAPFHLELVAPQLAGILTHHPTRSETPSWLNGTKITFPHSPANIGCVAARDIQTNTYVHGQQWIAGQQLHLVRKPVTLSRISKRHETRGIGRLH